MNLKLISCSVFHREMEQAIRRSPHRVDAEFLPQGLHDLEGLTIRARIQEAIDAVPEHAYDAILLGYGLCNNGLDGIQSRHTRLVMPGVHDCIAVFFGSHQRFADFVARQPGTLFRTSGWLESSGERPDIRHAAPFRQLGLDKSHQELVEAYGEDNADYLFDLFGHPYRHYTHLAYLAMGVEPDDTFEQAARREAENLELEFARLDGDLTLIQRMLNGLWDDPFVVAEPGEILRASRDDAIFAASE